MAKYFGNIGFAITTERTPGVWMSAMDWRPYSGDINHVVHRWEAGQNVNDDFNVNNEISIVADLFAWNHLSHIKAVEWNGDKWKVTAVQMEYPRLVLSIGGVYNEQSEA